MTAVDEEVAAQFVSTIQDWVKREVLPCAADYEKADRYPEHLVQQMKDFGLFGATSRCIPPSTPRPRGHGPYG